MNLEKLYDAVMYMEWRLKTLEKELSYDADSAARVIEGIGKLAADIDKAVGCGKGYDKLRWMSAKQLKGLVQPNQVDEIHDILSGTLLAFIDGVEEEWDKLAKMRQADVRKIESRREWICIMATQMAYLAMGMQCILQALRADESYPKS